MNAKATAASRKHPVFQRECKHSFHSNSHRRSLRGAAAAAAADMRVQVRCTRELRALRCAPDSDGATPRDRWQSPPPPQLRHEGTGSTGKGAAKGAGAPGPRRQHFGQPCGQGVRGYADYHTIRHSGAWSALTKRGARAARMPVCHAGRPTRFTGGLAAQITPRGPGPAGPLA